MSSAVTEPAPALDLQAVPSLRTNFKWTFAGSVIYAACQWGMLSILAKAGSATIVGQFALGLAIAAPVFMFTNLQLRAVQATDAKSEFEFCDYFTLRALASTLGLLTVAAIAWSLHYDLTTRLVVMLVAVAKEVESLSDVVAGLLQKFEKLDQVAVSLMIRGALSVAGFGGAFLATHRLPVAVAAMVLTWTAVFVGYDLWRARGVLDKKPVFFRLRSALLQKLLVISLPLGVVMTLNSLNVNIPRYVLVKYLGQAELGLFASLAYSLVAVNLVVTALGQSATARLSRMFACGDLKGFRRVMQRLMGVAAVILILGPVCAACFGRQALTILYRPEYGRDVAVLVVMAVSAGINAAGYFIGFGMTAARCFRMQVPVIACCTLVTAISALVLVPRFGLMGAAIALVAGAVVLAAGGWLVLRNALANAERA